ncbi:MAG: hypothetical protein PHY64_00195 [Eubacteriales bacterium]|nr:hypothetical protein [Eubacteriales bacterium]
MKFTFGFGQISQDGAAYRDAAQVAPEALVNYLKARCEPDAVVSTPSGTLHVWSISGLLCGFVDIDGTEIYNAYTYYNTVSAEAMAADIVARLSKGELDEVSSSAINFVASDYVTLVEYAKAHGITTNTLRQRIARGKHPEAIKPGHDWLIPRNAPYSDSRFDEKKL